MLKVLHVVGARPVEYVIFQLRLCRGGLFHRARPNFMKVAPITSTSSVQACGR